MTTGWSAPRGAPDDDISRALEHTHTPGNSFNTAQLKEFVRDHLAVLLVPGANYNEFFKNLRDFNWREQGRILGEIFLVQPHIYEWYLQYIHETHFNAFHEVPQDIAAIIRTSSIVQQASIDYVRGLLKSLASDQCIAWDTTMNFCLNILSLQDNFDYMRKIEGGSFGSVKNLLGEHEKSLAVLRDRLTPMAISWTTARNVTKILSGWNAELGEPESRFMIQLDRMITILDTFNKIALSRVPNEQSRIVWDLRDKLNTSIRSTLNTVAATLSIELPPVEDYDATQIETTVNIVLKAVHPDNMVDTTPFIPELRERIYRLVFLQWKVIANFSGFEGLMEWLDSTQVDAIITREKEVQDIAYDIKQKAFFGDNSGSNLAEKMQAGTIIRDGNKVRLTLECNEFKRLHIPGYELTDQEKDQAREALKAFPRIFMTAKYKEVLEEFEDFNKIIQICTDTVHEKMSTDELETIKWMVRYSPDITFDSLQRMAISFTAGRYNNHEHEEHKLVILQYVVERLTNASAPPLSIAASIDKVFAYLRNDYQIAGQETIEISGSLQSYARLYLRLAKYHLTRAESLQGNPSMGEIRMAKEAFLHAKNLFGENPLHTLSDKQKIDGFYSRLGYFSTRDMKHEHISPVVAKYIGERGIEGFINTTRFTEQLEDAIAAATHQIDARRNDHGTLNIPEILAPVLTAIRNTFFYGIGSLELEESIQCDQLGVQPESCTWRECIRCHKSGQCDQFLQKPGPDNRKVISLNGWLLRYVHPYTSANIVGPIFDREKSAIGTKIQLLLNTISTVSALQASRNHEHWNATHDIETNLLNQRALDAMLDGNMDISPMHHIVSVRMKGQNDEKSLRSKDFLRHITRKISNIDSDILKYYTGDIFVFLLPISRFGYSELMTFIYDFEQILWNSDNESVNTSSVYHAYIGYSVQNGSIPQRELYDQSLLALDTAKIHGGTVYYSKDLQAEYDEKEEKRAMLDDALYGNEKNRQYDCVSFYQPIVLGETTKYEALLRIYDRKTWLYHPPQPFLDAIKDISHQNRYQTDISFRMLENIIYDMGKYPKLDVSFNMHAFDFFEGAVYSRLIVLDQALRKRITIEVLESVDLKTPYTNSQVGKLSELWFKIAFDDYGIDRSNTDRFAYYDNPDFVKIDQLFVKKLDAAIHGLSETYQELDTFLCDDPATLSKINTLLNRDGIWTEKSFINYASQKQLPQEVAQYLERINNPQLNDIVERAFASDMLLLQQSLLWTSKTNEIRLNSPDSIIIAEFVEDTTLCDILKTFGVQWFQWYGIGRPAPIHTFFQRNQ